MRTNCDLTIYHKSVDSTTRTEVWTPQQINRVLWENRKGANVLRSGLIEADSVTVYIPFERGEIEIKPGDVLVKGRVSDLVSSAFTITDLKQKYPESATVRSVDKMDYGSAHMQHWEIGAG